MRVAGIIGLVAALALAAFFAARVECLGGVRGRGEPGGGPDVMALLFGEARKVVSNSMFDRAELYFHGGVQEAADECAATGHSHAESPGGALAAAASLPDDQAKHAEHAEHDGQAASAGREWDWWSAINRRVHPAAHQHLPATGEKEVVPWLWASAKVDPHNVQAYSVGAYWLGRRLGNWDEAVRFIEEGIRHNPESFDLEFCRGELLVARYPRAPEKSLRAFEAALQKLKPEQFADVADLEMFRRRLLQYLGDLNLRAGDLAAARKWYQELLRIYPQHGGVQKKLQEIDGLERTKPDARFGVRQALPF